MVLLPSWYRDAWSVGSAMMQCAVPVRNTSAITSPPSYHWPAPALQSEDVQLTPVIRGGKVVGLVVQLEDRSISRLVNECANLNRGMMRTRTPLTGPQPVLSLINTSHLGNTAESAPQMAGMALGESGAEGVR